MNKFNLKADIKAGFSVFLLALPLSLGISMASNFPAISGVITAIIGGILGSLVLSSSRLTIKGPAAGMIVVALGAVTELGAGDFTVGHKKALACIAVASILQIMFALFKWANLAEMIPSSVIDGMLTAIGVIIISKQAHVMFGVKPVAKNALGLLAEIPASLGKLNPAIFCIGLSSLLLVFFWPKLKKLSATFPASMLVLVISIPLAFFMGLGIDHNYQFWGNSFSVGPKFLINLHGGLLSSLTFPNFNSVWSGTSLKYILMFSLVGSIESLLTVCAVDTLDPEKKKSNLNGDLIAIGICNLIASLCGGLPMISEIVRTRANIDYGAKDRWANFSHGMFLLLSILFLPHLLQKIPLAALAALLVFTGTRLASPSELKKSWHLGADEFVYFMTTFLLTLMVDILVGVGIGLLLQVVHHLVRGAKPKELFRSNIKYEQKGDEMHMKFTGPVVFTCYLHISKRITEVLTTNGKVVLDFTEAQIVDRTISEKLEAFKNDVGENRLSFAGKLNTKRSGQVKAS